ncbi:hypothetical protein BCD67_02920 [Oscillatoriales cyanobacterium USR001]|nr:hypothetical protein BCD67_02920 [Oscillatoriales cyanobacterium USR001]
MDKDIWLQIEEDSKSFEEALLLTSKLISIPLRYLRDARLIDRAYEVRKTFTLKDWRKLHNIAVSLWYRQYYSSSNSFNYDDFSSNFLPKYQKLISFLLQKSTEVSQLQNVDSLKSESFKIWQEFMAKLAYLSNMEQKSGKKQKKRGLDQDSQFTIVTVITLILGLSLAIFVILINR